MVLSFKGGVSFGVLFFVCLNVLAPSFFRGALYGISIVPLQNDPDCVFKRVKKGVLQNTTEEASDPGLGPRIYELENYSSNADQKWRLKLEPP